MRRRWAQNTLLATLALLLLGAGIWHAAATRSAGDPARAARASASDPTAPASLYASVDAGPIGPPRPAGFLGLSLEYSALEAYTGADPAALDPVFVQLLRNLGQPLILRIGGNSTDQTWWPVHGTSAPPGVNYTLSPTWLASARALAAAVDAKLILGVNLAAARPRLSAAEAAALLRGIGTGYVGALELGNEPDVYGVFPWYRTQGRPIYARSPSYSLAAYAAESSRTAARLPGLPLAGPASAELSWLSGLQRLAASEPRLQTVTVHRYALQGCLANPSSPAYPSIENLFSDRSSIGLAKALVPYIGLAHARGLSFRVDELNSAALAGCLGRSGVSNTFASALWMVDTLFNLASVGVDGVNIHSLPGAGYEPFTFRQTGAGWQAFVRPDYYGMLMFAKAFPTGARLLPVHAPSGPVKVWATLGADGHTRVTLINKDSRPHRVELQLPPSAAPAQVELLRASSAGATSGVTLGGQSFGPETGTGELAAPRLQPVSQLFGSYAVELPPSSAALLTR